MKRGSVDHSGIYSGVIRHRRFDRVGHRFSVHLNLVYLDLDEIEAAFAGRWFWSATRLAPMWFRRADYFGPAEVPLGDAVRDAVAQQTGRRPEGPVRVLTSLRCFGYAFHPVSFYYCFDRGERLVALLAEITNTPWGERHHYVVGVGPDGRAARRFAKEFHVSPFQPMEHDYVWRFSAPGARLAVHMENHAASGKAFDATLVMTRRPWCTRNLVLAWLRHPWPSLKVIAAIHWHALRLWLRRAPFHVHPGRRAKA